MGAAVFQRRSVMEQSTFPLSPNVSLECLVNDALGEIERVPGEFPILAQTSRAKSNCGESAQISGLVLSLTYDGNARLDRTSQSSKLSRNACVQKSRRDWRLIRSEEH